jgi:hypothetical protein
LSEDLCASDMQLQSNSTSCHLPLNFPPRPLLRYLSSRLLPSLHHRLILSTYPLPRLCLRPLLLLSSTPTFPFSTSFSIASTHLSLAFPVSFLSSSSLASLSVYPHRHPPSTQLIVRLRDLFASAHLRAHDVFVRVHLREVKGENAVGGSGKRCSKAGFIEHVRASGGVAELVVCTVCGVRV